MSTLMPARFVKGVSLILFVLALAAPAWSQERSTFAKEGGYAGISGLLDFTLDGLTFDGASVYQRENGEEILILPRLEGKSMLRTIVGLRSARGAFEVSYDQTTHVGSFLGAPGEATFHSINGDERIFLLTGGRFQPYVLLGGSLPWLTIKDGSLLDPDVGNATFRGWGVNTEGGVTVFVHPRFGISTGYRYRAMWFDHASGVSEESYKLRPRFHETSGSIVMTGLFTF